MILSDIWRSFQVSLSVPEIQATAYKYSKFQRSSYWAIISAVKFEQKDCYKIMMLSTTY